MTTRLAVLGSPIAHSKSPALHRAAYDVLGLPWTYDAIEVADGGLDAFLADLDDSWRGLSLTMPLKREVLPLLDTLSPLADEVGAANTVLLRDGSRQGFNTDVPGITGAFRDAGIVALDSVHVLGAGATAASVLSAVSRLGASQVTIFARDPGRARSLEPLAASLGIELVIRRLGEHDRSMITPSALIATLPGGTSSDMAFAEDFRQRVALLDVAYDPWPSVLASSWAEAGGTVISGLSMLLHQAIAQVRIFVNGVESGELDHEAEVIAAMRAAVGL